MGGGSSAIAPDNHCVDSNSTLRNSSQSPKKSSSYCFCFSVD